MANRLDVQTCVHKWQRLPWPQALKHFFLCLYLCVWSVLLIQFKELKLAVSLGVLLHFLGGMCYSHKKFSEKRVNVLSECDNNFIRPQKQKQ